MDEEIARRLTEPRDKIMTTNQRYLDTRAGDEMAPWVKKLQGNYVSPKFTEFLKKSHFT